MTSQQDELGTWKFSHVRINLYLPFTNIRNIHDFVKEFVILETKCLKNEEQINHQNMINLIKKS